MASSGDLDNLLAIDSMDLAEVSFNGEATLWVALSNEQVLCLARWQQWASKSLDLPYTSFQRGWTMEASKRRHT